MGFKIKELFWVADDSDEEFEQPPAAEIEPGSTPVGTSGVAPPEPRSGQRLQGGHREIQRALATLRDVNGVVGSLLIRTDGALLACDLPGYFQVDIPERVAGRIAQLYAALGQSGEPRQKIAARYEQHVFHITESAAGLIGVLTERDCNSPALGMAVRLVGRRIGSDANVGA